MTPRKQAIAKNEMYYFTGKPCKAGHIAKRATDDRTCYECRITRSRKWKENVNYKETAKDSAKARTAEYRKNNPDKVTADNAKRRAAKLNATPKWLSKEQHEEIKEFFNMAKELEKVFPWKQHVDHIVPLNHDKVCGLHTPWNLQILSEKANMEKSNKFEVA
jgi:hypothetical protein